MLRHLKHPALIAIAPLATLALLLAASPASAATTPPGGVVVTSPPPANICLYGSCAETPFTSDGTTVPGPPPACDNGYCIPQTPICDDGSFVPQQWYVATKVLTNEGVYRFGTPVEGDNPTPVEATSCASLSQTVSGSATASLMGTFGVSGEEVAGAVLQVQPGVSATVGYSYTFAGSAPCPPDTNVTIYFGIGYVQTTGTVYTLSSSGEITSQSGVEATAPTGWAYYYQYTPAVVGS